MIERYYNRWWRWSCICCTTRRPLALLVFVYCFSCLITATTDDGHDALIRVEAFSPPVSRSTNYKYPTCGTTVITQQPPEHSHQKKQVLLHSPVVLFSTTSSDDNGSKNDNTGVVVYSVFSKTPKQVFEVLVEAVPSKKKKILELETILETWDELNEIIDDGDVSVQEVQDLFVAASEGNDGLDQSAFEAFYRSIDDLFDDDADDYNSPEDSSDDSKNKAGTTTETATTDPKTDLLEYLAELQNLECETTNGEVNIGKRQPWGLDSSDKERATIFEKIEALCVEGDSNNLLGVGSIINSDKELTKHVLGTWDLKYTSSRTMLINKSLSGLGRSTSDLVENKGLRMNLRGTHYFGEVEFVETFAGSGDDDDDKTETAERDDDDDPIRIDFTVNGEWMLETGTRTDPRTGRPSVSLRIEVDTVAYGPQKSTADQWDSLGPIKLVDILYLDETVMVVRGNFNVDAIFVYERIR